MIDARTPVRALLGWPDKASKVPLLRWRTAWDTLDGRGATVGLLDGCFTVQHPDLVGADIIIRDFVGCIGAPALASAHATHAVTTLVGQGLAQIRGLAPRARLLVATVVGSDGVAHVDAMACAMDWLLTCGATIVAIPLGDSVDQPVIAQQIGRATGRGVVLFAAAGNAHPDSVLFPARHEDTIAVGAVDGRGQLLPSCCRVGAGLDVAAPGSGIHAGVAEHWTQRCDGSSVACVLAAGVASLASSTGFDSEPSCRRNELLRVISA